MKKERKKKKKNTSKICKKKGKKSIQIQNNRFNLYSTSILNLKKSVFHHSSVSSQMSQSKPTSTTTTTTTLQRVLVANRGEIAVRIIRACRELGKSSVALYTDVDRDSAHTTAADSALCLGAAAERAHFLDVDALVAAAKSVHCDALHPGYGFASESAALAIACARAGIVFVGPPPNVLAQMGDKIAAKRFVDGMRDPARPRTVPGFSLNDADAATVRDDVASSKRVAALCVALGKPLLIKAAAGGGGKGMRIVHEPVNNDHLSPQMIDAIASARSEAASSFGSPQLLVERYVARGRHIEVQIIGDTHGVVLHLFERECSIQRRHQKIIEESPSPALDDALRARFCAAAVAIGTEMGYIGAGTVEFILDDVSKEFFFLEVNARVQVEHPVTELITGLDIVRLQLGVAEGKSLAQLGVTQASVKTHGHSIECRVNAEDWHFAPQIGTVRHIAWPAGVRCDTALRAGNQVTVFYDSMLAKLIVHGATRAESLARMAAALRRTTLLGVPNNVPYLIAAIQNPVFVDGRAIDTHFVAQHMSPSPPPVAREDAALIALAAALLAWHQAEQQRTTWRHVGSGWNAIGPRPLQRRCYALTSVAAGAGAADQWRSHVRVCYRAERSRDGSAAFAVRFDWPPTGADDVAALAHCGEANFEIGDDAGDPLINAELIGVAVDRVSGAALVDLRLAQRRMRVWAASETVVSDGSSNVYLRFEAGDAAAGAAIVARRISALARAGSAAATVTAGAAASRIVDDCRRYLAAMPCKVVKVHARVGATVAKGEPLFELESMKMQTTYGAEEAGVVKRVGATDGQVIAAGTPIVDVQPTNT
jgi:acetyl/propionyl-CoA carboxylase alpha subunit